MQGTCFTSQHWEKEDGTYNSMESYVHSYKKVRKTQHTHKPGNAFKTTTLPSTGVIYSICSVSTVLNFVFGSMQCYTAGEKSKGFKVLK